MPKIFLKIVGNCYECPGYYSARDYKPGICQVADSHEVTNPFTIYGWCPLVNKQDIRTISNIHQMETGYIHTIKK